jgi:chemotaxis protein CheX
MEQYIQPFIDVSTSVFKELLHCTLIPEKVFFVEKEAFNSWDISGVIGLSGEVKGAVAISMKTETAIKLTEILTESKHEYLDSEVVDAIGEIVNIIAGNAKKNLEEMFKLVISLPTIVKGKAHFIVWSAIRTRIFCIPFKIFDNETICLSVALDKQ